MHRQGHHGRKGPLPSCLPSKASVPPPQQPIPALYPITNTTFFLSAITIASSPDQYRIPFGLDSLDLLSALLFCHNKESIAQIDPLYSLYFHLP